MADDSTFRTAPVGRDDRQVKVVADALDFIRRTNIDKNIQDEKNRNIQQLFEMGFQVYNPTGTHLIDSKKLYQAIWRTMNRTKMLDFSIHGAGMDEDVEKIIGEGIGMVMTEGGHGEALMGKEGCIVKALMYGDGFEMVGKNPDEDSSIPLVYTSISNNNVWVDNYCTSIRGTGVGKSATECCVIFGYRWQEACRIFPNLKKIGGKGRIPRGDYDKDQDKTYLQTYEVNDDLVEVAFYYDLARKRYAVFAGSACTLLEVKKKDNYPFFLKGSPYIPVLQWICMPSSEGFYNHGIGDMLYQLALVSSRLLNMEINHIEDNVYPINLINVPSGNAAEFFQKLVMANESRKVGKKPFVAMEYDPNNPTSSQVSSETLLTQNLFNEWQAIYDRLDAEIKRMGIYLDEGDYANYPNKDAVAAEEENSTAFVKQMMEYNTLPTKFAVELTIEQVKESVAEDNDEPLNMTTTIVREGVEVPIGKSMTLGKLARELNSNKVFVKVNSRSGAIPSNVLQQTQVTRLLGSVQPGSPAYYKLLRQYAQLNDRDLALEDFEVAAPEQADGQAEGQPIPVEEPVPV